MENLQHELRTQLGRRSKDRTGHRYGRLVVIEFVSTATCYGKTVPLWRCICDCGTEKTLPSNTLASGATQSCGCSHRNDARGIGLPRGAPDLHGRRFGQWLVVAYVAKRGHHASRWMCRCDCGTERPVSSTSLLSGKSSSCGRHAVDMIGKRFGFWTVIGRAGKRPVTWRVRCDCGVERVHQGANLKSGSSTSCGCRFALAPGEAATNDLLSTYRWGAERRGKPFELTRDEFVSLVSSACHYCGIAPSLPTRHGLRLKTGIVYNGIDRVDNNGGYTASNVVPCCETCNRAKRFMSPQLFLAWVSRVYAFSVKRSTKKTSAPPQAELLLTA